MRFIEQAQLDFQDFAIVGDATWTFDDGVLTLTVDLNPVAPAAQAQIRRPGHRRSRTGDRGPRSQPN